MVGIKRASKGGKGKGCILGVAPWVGEVAVGTHLEKRNHKRFK